MWMYAEQIESKLTKLVGNKVSGLADIIQTDWLDTACSTGSDGDGAMNLARGEAKLKAGLGSRKAWELRRREWINPAVSQ